MRRLFVPFFAVCVLAACAGPHTSFNVTDAREETRFGDSRSTVAGAEIILPDEDFTPTLVDRLADRFQRDLGARLAGRDVKITVADAKLLVEDARVLPPRRLAGGMRVQVVRSVRATAHKIFTVQFAGEVAGKPFKSEATESWVVGTGDLEVSRAVNRALQGASTDLAAKL